MSTHLLGSTVLMGLLFGAIFLALSRLGARHGAGAAAEGAIEPYTGTGGRVESTLETPGRLGAVFLAIALLAGGLAVIAVGGPGANVLGGGLFGVLVGLLGLLLTGFVFGGSYVFVRSHGLGPAHGVAVGLFVTGVLFAGFVSADLLFGFLS